MDIVLYLMAALFLSVGFIGCFLPIIPGPPLSYIGLFLLQFTENVPFTSDFMVTWFIITVVVQVLDYVIPTYGTKRYGGSRAGVAGSVIGLILGVFMFPPLGIIIGPLAGALIGELITGRKSEAALRSAWGSFVGFLVGTVMKLAASSTMFYLYFEAVIARLA